MGCFYELLGNIPIIFIRKNMRVLHKSKLWKESETTCNFISPELSFSQEKRFKLHSIYWPDKQSANSSILNTRLSGTHEVARRISKLIDQQQKTQQRMGKSERASLKRINFAKTGNISRGSITLRETNTSNISRSNQETIKRLSFYSQRPQSTFRDKFGFRSPMSIDDPEMETDRRMGFARERRLESASKGFRTSKRVDLKLPHNFNPGPGAYRIIRYLENSDKQSYLP